MKFEHPKTFEKDTKVTDYRFAQFHQDPFWAKREALFNNIEKRTEELIKIAKANGF